MTPRVKAEWHSLQEVVVHRPGIEMFFGLLAPDASLYERAFSRHEARIEHELLEYTLREQFRVHTTRLKDDLLFLADRKPEIRQRLLEFALGSVEYSGSSTEVELATRRFKEDSSRYDAGHFFDIGLLRPRILLREGSSANAVHINITERDPLANLYFMRDQQATTDLGVYVSRMSKPQRRAEPALTSLYWEAKGLKPVHATQAPGTFEGGDFMPMGEFALVGTGDRTNEEGVAQLLAHGLNFDEVAVVEQPAHPLIPGEERDPMVNMHLDTYFNVAGSSTVVASELLIRRARVRVYHRTGFGAYTQEAGRTNLHDFIRSKGFNIVPLTTLEQLSYASNFLCIRDGVILAVDVRRSSQAVLEDLAERARINPLRYKGLLDQAKRDLETLKATGGFFPNKPELFANGIDAYTLNMTNLTGGYGGAHCMTAVVSRT